MRLVLRLIFVLLVREVLRRVVVEEPDSLDWALGVHQLLLFDVFSLSLHPAPGPDGWEAKVLQFVAFVDDCFVLFENLGHSFHQSDFFD